VRKPWLFDGSMGALLAQRGALSGGCTELLNRTNPQAVTAIYADYAAAGADFIKTNTFGASRFKLAQYGLADAVDELNAAAVRMAKSVCGGAKVALSVGPTGQMLPPAGTGDPDAVTAAFGEQMQAAADAGADAILIETQMDLAEARAACLAALPLGLPIFLSFTLEGGRTLMGNPMAVLAAFADGLGVSMLGLNCSGGPQQLLPHFLELQAAATTPVMVMPNAGLPIMENGKTHFPLEAQGFAELMQPFVVAGAWAVGGCCGTTPEHIAALRVVCDAAPGSVENATPTDAGKTAPIAPRDMQKASSSDSQNAPARGKVMCSPRQICSIQDAARAAQFTLDTADVNTLVENAMDEAYGAPLLHVELGGASPAIIRQWLAEFTLMCQVPLAFCAKTPEQLQAALHHYVGIAGVSGEADAHILARYGGVFFECS